MTYHVAVIGVGPGREVDVSGKSHAWAYLHADAFVAREDCEVVACVDIVPDYGAKFAEEFDIDDAHVFEDHETMLSAVDPDLVSICTPIRTHADITIDCAKHDSVTAIHCEKPMAATWSGARAMAHICDLEGVQLTIGHQRRFGDPFLQTKSLLDSGVVGELDRIEISWGNFFDNGSHTVDLAAKFNDEHRVEWVLGQLDYSEEHIRYGIPTADHAFVSWQYENGVHGIAATGDGVELTGGPYDFYDCWFRLVCADGVIELGRHDGPPLRYRRDGEGWTEVEVVDEFTDWVGASIDDIVEALSGAGRSELRAENALRSTELLFAGHESSRRRSRVELPMRNVYDHPLVAMIESGEIVPKERADGEPVSVEHNGSC